MTANKVEVTASIGATTKSILSKIKDMNENQYRLVSGLPDFGDDLITHQVIKLVFEHSSTLRSRRFHHNITDIGGFVSRAPGSSLHGVDRD
jgi:hypothetical protein